MNRAMILSAVVVLAGCEADIAPVTDPDQSVVPIDISTSKDTHVATPDVALCDSGKKYVGFGGQDLTADRKEAEVGLERARMKPFSALQTEFPRVLGNTPALLGQSESTFGITPPRWMPQPQSSAIALYTAYRVAFQGCLTVTQTPAKYNVAPTQATAMTECAGWAKKFWSRAALGPEIEACAKIITTESATETDLRRRWSYGCASILTSSDFLTY